MAGYRPVPDPRARTWFTASGHQGPDLTWSEARRRELCGELGAASLAFTGSRERCQSGSSGNETVGEVHLPPSHNPASGGHRIRLVG